MLLSVLITLIIIACVLLILIVLIQNPKGGGLGSTFGGISNQMLGVQRTTDFLEKGTWGLAITVCALTLLTIFFVPKKGADKIDVKAKDLKANPVSATPQPTAAPLNTPAPGATDKGKAGAPAPKKP